MTATTDTRPPLRLTASQAVNWFSLHSEDIGREIVIVASPVVLPSDEDLKKPLRTALGHNAAGVWVWADEAEGNWP